MTAHAENSPRNIRRPIVTRHRPRLTDGQRHPVTVRKVGAR